MKEYEVGYGKPPREYQFRKGKCPNLAGRGKKPPINIGEATRDKLSEMVSVELRGRTVRMTRMEAFLTQTALSAAKGNVGDAGLLLSVFETAERNGDIGDIIVRVYGGPPD